MVERFCLCRTQTHVIPFFSSTLSPFFSHGTVGRFHTSLSRFAILMVALKRKAAYWLVY